MKVVLFQSNFRVTIPGNCTISRYCYPEIYKFPSNNTLKLKMSGYCYPEIDPAFLPFGQFPGIVTWKLKIVKFPGIVTQKLTISENQYSEIGQFPGIYTRKLINFRVTIPGNSTTKKKGNIDFWVTIPGSCKFPGIVTRKLLHFRVTILGFCSQNLKIIIFKQL